MNDGCPTMPGHFKQALGFNAGVDDDDLIQQIWEVLCEDYGQAWAGHFQVTIKCPDDRPEEDE